ncbi:MAG: hypothetical protein GY913_03165 [Proteobacteria bacterium]|nr:hypothetical protein [Pseudomonadota bacterium]MCP4915900.1 hypothetical protein [Pseudomonadota bacterium]
MIWLLACSMPATFDAGGLRVQEQSQLVSVHRAGSTQPVVGTWSTEAGMQVFQPLTPLTEGTWEAQLADGRVLVHEVPRRESVVGEVVRIWPTGPVPSNLLGFHVSFSAPVPVIERELLGPDGPDPEAFADVSLWSEDRTQLNVLLHPSRTKTGIPFAEELGPNLVEGSTYTLVLNGAEHPFEVGPADHARPVPEDWHVDGTTLRFDERLRSDLNGAAWRVRVGPDRSGRGPGRQQPRADVRCARGRGDSGRRGADAVSVHGVVSAGVTSGSAPDPS